MASAVLDQFSSNGVRIVLVLVRVVLLLVRVVLVLGRASSACRLRLTPKCIEINKIYELFIKIN